MDRYDRFLADIILKTRKEELRWQPVPLGRYSDYIVQNQFVYQVFRSDFEKKACEYVLLFVNKKVPTIIDDLNTLWDEFHSELLVIEDGALIITLGEEYVNTRALSELRDEIEARNTSAERLFDDLE